MTDANLTIVSLYEQGLTPEEIATDQGYDVEAVKMALLNGSVKFREDTQTRPAESECKEISDDEMAYIAEVYKNLAFGTDNPFLKEKMLRNLWNEKKGRNDIGKLLKGAGGNINITQVNLAIQKTREALKRVREKKPLELEAA